jgi:hypothetical protein
MTDTATPQRLARHNQKPAPTTERVMVASDALLSVFGSHAPCGTISDVDDLGATLGTIAAKLAATLEGRCLGLVLAPDGKLVRGAAIADDEPFMGWATALGTIDAGCLVTGGGWDGAERLSCFVFGGHGVRWLGDCDCDWLVLGLAGGQLAKDLPVVDWISLGDVGSGRFAEDFYGLEEIGKTPVDVEGGDLVSDVGGDGHGIWWFAGASLPADSDNLSQRRVLSRKISNYFHGPESGSFSPLNA